jgi:hypothetical protein
MYRIAHRGASAQQRINAFNFSSFTKEAKSNGQWRSVTFTQAAAVWLRTLRKLRRHRCPRFFAHVRWARKRPAREVPEPLGVLVEAEGVADQFDGQHRAVIRPGREAAPAQMVSVEVQKAWPMPARCSTVLCGGRRYKSGYASPSAWRCG